MQDIVHWDYGSWPDGLPKKGGANALSGVGSLDTATTCLSKTSRTKNFIIELNNHLPTILEQLTPYRDALEGVVVESTYNWYWLVDGLMEADYRVHLANPSAIQQYSG